MKKMKVKNKNKISKAICKLLESSDKYNEKVLAFKKILIEMSLKKNNYSITHTAIDLGKNRTALYREMDYLGIKYKSSLSN